MLRGFAGSSVIPCDSRKRTRKCPGRLDPRVRNTARRSPGSDQRDRSRNSRGSPALQGVDTMNLNRIATLGLVLALSVTVASAEDKTVKSGPQVGEELAGPFHPLNVNGKAAGKKF